ncbi:DUF302 domain-containing protein [Phototrophicus methaneseepsis]|uniref:DUF302 domain-containing protein n=2 Tax=Phototrophicus methaneseepsis TaxID=2710758 RepID=A0A7S8IH80_9CHLR|nr:DUF302 domain-containing protein [Phototrophicus methaneseepsis]
MVTAEKYGLKKTLSIDFDAAEAKVLAALKEQGFGILTEINVQNTLKQKLDVDMARYKILGACNPPLAHKALQAETEVGLLLPCNVVIYEDAQAGNTVVMAIDPMTMVQISDNEALQDVAVEAKARLEKALAAL